MTSQTVATPLPPVPSAQIFSDKQGLLTQPAQQWLVNLRDKVNLINAIIVTISGAGTPSGVFNEISPLTTKGDMLTYNSGNIRLPIGTNGQILSVVSGLPAWVNPTAGSSPLTTKGDVYGFSTTPTRVPVGADGQVLTARSSNANGVDWETPQGIILPPSSISGLLHWWNPTPTSFTHGGSQVTVNGNPVDTWVDQVSSGGINFVQATSGAQPTLNTSGAGGFFGLNFNGSTQCMASASAISIQGFTLYMVLAMASSSSSGAALEQSVNSASNDGFLIYIPTNATVNYRRTQQDAYNLGTSWVFGGIYNHIIINLGGISQKNYPLINGTLYTTPAISNPLSLTTANDFFYLMSRASSSLFLNGTVMEIVLFNRCLSAGERLGLLSYGQVKYGV